ncbi:Uncharacterised protein [Streptococcus pneumoniae]|nr:Uncharacterised protein [Streptococcus pneumoniae]
MAKKFFTRQEIQEILEKNTRLVRNLVHFIIDDGTN